MNSTPVLEEKFIKYKACILLPTYNNHQTIVDVIQNSLAQT